MDRREVAEQLMKDLGENRLVDLIKRLEIQSGLPVQIDVRICVDTPDSLNEDSEARDSGVGRTGMVFTRVGSLYDRLLTVRRVPALSIEYVSDVALLEGDYESMRDLSCKIDELDFLYDCSVPRKVMQIICKKFRRIGPLSIPLFRSSEESENNGLHHQEVCDFLASEGISFLRHRLDASPAGVYDTIRIEGDCRDVYLEPKKKVADVVLKYL